MRQTVAEPALTDQPLAALKAWLAITGTREDALLADCLAVACSLCERFTGVVPLAARYREILASDSALLATASRPVRDLIAVTALGENERLLPSEAYDAVLAADGSLSLRLLVPLAEPRVAIDLECGSAGTWDDLDAALRHGILRHAAHLYRERDNGRADTIPAAVAALWRPYRRVQL